jgi:hypothetical protein
VRKLLSLVGALVVFATFIVKDTLRDESEELASKVSAARVTFAIRQDSLRVREDLSIMSVGDRLPNSFSTTNQKDDVTRFLAFTRPEVEASAARLELVKELEQAVWRSTEYSKSEALETQLGRVREFVTTLSDAALKGDYHNPVYHGENDMETGDPVPHNLRALVFGDLMVISSRIKDYQTAIFRGAHSAARDAEEKLASYSRMSWWLYVAGWTLALFGKLAEFN